MLRFRRIEHWKIIAVGLAFYDVLAVSLSYLFCLWVRFDCRWTLIPEYYMVSWQRFAPIYAIVCVLVFSVMKMYRSIWRFVSYSELFRVTAACLFTSLFHAAAITTLYERMPVSYYLFGALLQYMLVLGVRFSYRLYLAGLRRASSGNGQEENSTASKVMLIGAGAAGQMLLRDIQNAPELNDRVVCIIDDNSNKWNRYVEGVPVVGGRDEILVSVMKYDVDKIYLAIPSASAKNKRDILNICKETSCELKMIPGMYQVVKGEVSVSTMKKVTVEDLLGRDPVAVNDEEILESLSGKVILVTGGGGSIGSELCRQIARHSPSRLIIFDCYENNAYQIQQELKRSCPGLDLVTVIGSVRDSRRIDQVFRLYRPEIVYHAAAHKHVPLMEESPNEAIKNNVVGTYKTAYAAMKYGTRRFVLISTDKAVNPTNIMGASKRLCEMVIQSLDRVSREGREELLPLVHAHSDDVGHADGASLDHRMMKNRQSQIEFVAVRFGNVLGSNGSVIPLFKQQIEEGGPVTVTHPEIIRYFMTIPEAVSLILQAGAYARGGEIFILDMGDPVKIIDLARNLIRLSGYRPDTDIQIVYTGLRPGEKLYEEKLMSEEGLKMTPNKLIHVGEPLPMDIERFLGELGELAFASYDNSPDIKEIVKRMVPTYHPYDEKKAAGSGQP